MENIMATLFVVLIALSLYHFIYESLIVPWLRLEIQVRINKLRVRLNNLNIGQNSLEVKSFAILDESLAHAEERVHLFNISERIRIRKILRNNPSINNDVVNIKNLIRNSPNKEIKEIEGKFLDYTFSAFLINSGGWAYLIIPILIIVLLFVLCYSIIKNLNFPSSYKKIKLRFKRGLQSIAVLPNKINNQVLGMANLNS